LNRGNEECPQEKEFEVWPGKYAVFHLF
jgi:hypothetical protein